MESSWFERLLLIVAAGLVLANVASSSEASGLVELYSLVVVYVCVLIYPSRVLFQWLLEQKEIGYNRERGTE